MIEADSLKLDCEALIDLYFAFLGVGFQAGTGNKDSGWSDQNLQNHNLFILVKLVLPSLFQRLYLASAARADLDVIHSPTLMLIVSKERVAEGKLLNAPRQLGF